MARTMLGDTLSQGLYVGGGEKVAESHLGGKGRGTFVGQVRQNKISQSKKEWVQTPTRWGLPILAKQRGGRVKKTNRLTAKKTFIASEKRTFAKIPPTGNRKSARPPREDSLGKQGSLGQGGLTGRGGECRKKRKTQPMSNFIKRKETKRFHQERIKAKNRKRRQVHGLPGGGGAPFKETHTGRNRKSGA